MTGSEWVALAMLWWTGGRGAIARWLLDPEGASRPRHPPSDRLESVAAEIDPRLLVGSRLGEARVAAARALATAGRLGITPLAWCNPAYPTALAVIPDPPPVLWVRGDPTALSTPAVALVGSRAGSPYALEVARGLGTALAERGVTVVSGLARGVDSAAHRGALAGVGRTVAVLGSGVDIVYPPEHSSLADEIIQRGTLVSEFPPGTAPRPAHFPLRNRLISGLSRAVVVVEAAERSGSLITARLGLEQGREVMAVPGNVLGGRNRGSHALLKDGAKLVEHVDDILEEIQLPRSSPTAEGRESAPDDPLLRRMQVGESYDLDRLVALSGLDGARLLTRLLELELTGCVIRVAGGRFTRRAAVGQ